MARSCNVWCLVAVLSLLVAATSAYRTFTTVEVLSNEAGGRCQQEIQQATQRLRSCRMYLMERHRYVELANEKMEGWREHFPKCCNQLERMSEQCRCQAIKQVAQGQVQGELQGMEKQEMFRTAESLPSLCRIAPRKCQIIRGGKEQEEIESVF